MQQYDLFPQQQGQNSTSGEAILNTSDAVADRQLPQKKTTRELLKDETEFFDGELLYIREFLKAETAARLFNALQAGLKWEQSQIRVYGKWQTIPRLQAWYGDAEAAYQYSGVMMEPLAWTKDLFGLKQACEKYSDSRFNSVLANLYRDGQDCMGFHSDDERELGPQPVIASLTLGGVRNFDLVHKRQPYKLRIPLKSGSLLVMKGTTQQHWQHGIARTKKPANPRINLTFRQIRPL